MSDRPISKRLVRLVVALSMVFAAVGVTFTFDASSAQGWRRPGQVHANWGGMRGRFGGRPGWGPRAFGPRAFGPRRFGPGAFGPRPFGQRFFGARAIGARGGPRAFAGAFGRFQRRPVFGEAGFTGVPPAGETRFVSQEMVFHANPNVPPQVVENAARRLGLSTIDTENISLTGGTLLHFRLPPGRDVSDVIRELEAQKIGIAQPNYVFKLQQAPNLASATTFGDLHQYVANKLRLPEVHRISLGSNVVVAVIDSEIDLKHPDLVGAFSGSFDAVGKQEKPHAHGTGMAGAIAAHRALIGIAPAAHILAIHAFSSDATRAEATTDYIIRGIDWAIKKGARIINMSFAGPDDPTLQVALKKAREKGVILIAAAGNDGPDSPPLYPGADPNVIAVTATDEHDALFADANRGPYISVAAPGVDILEPAPSGGYQITTGTSVAAAHVSGVAALLLERDPKLDADALRDLLQSSAKALGGKGRNDEFGWGLVDPYRALQALDARSGSLASTPADVQRASSKPRQPFSSQ